MTNTPASVAVVQITQDDREAAAIHCGFRHWKDLLAWGVRDEHMALVETLARHRLAFQQSGGEAEPLHFEDHPIGKEILAVRHRAASNFAPEFSGQRGEDFDRGLLSAFEAANRARQIEAQKRTAPDAALREAEDKRLFTYAVAVGMSNGGRGTETTAWIIDNEWAIWQRIKAATPSQKQGEGPDA